MMKKQSIKEDPTIVNIYVPNIRAHKNVKQILTNMKGKVDSNTIIIENFKTPLSSLDHSDKKSIRTLGLNSMLNQMNPTDIHRTFHPRAAEYAFSSAYGMSSRINYVRHKTSLNKFKKIDVISDSHSDHSYMKPEINHRKKTNLKLSTQQRKHQQNEKASHFSKGLISKIYKEPITT